MRKYSWLCSLVLCMILLMCISARADRTQQEAVAEMTWGANLSSLYMAGGYDDETVNWDPDAVKQVGYVKNAQIGIGVSFWDNSFDWMCYTSLHSDSFECSVRLPSWTGNRSAWFDGMFELFAFVGRESALTAQIRLDSTDRKSVV